MRTSPTKLTNDTFILSPIKIIWVIRVKNGILDVGEITVS